MNKEKKEKAVFILKILIAITLLLLIITTSYSYYTVYSKNYCKTQNNTETPKNIVQNVIWQFEVFQSTGKTTKVIPCVSKSFLETGFLNEQFFDFSLVFVEFQEIIKQSEDTFMVKVSEKRQYFKSGVSGGSYIYKWVPVWITLKKIDNRWLITNYRDEYNNY